MGYVRHRNDHMASGLKQLSHILKHVYRIKQMLEDVEQEHEVVFLEPRPAFADVANDCHIGVLAEFGSHGLIYFHAGRDRARVNRLEPAQCLPGGRADFENTRRGLRQDWQYLMTFMVKVAAHDCSEANRSPCRG